MRRLVDRLIAEEDHAVIGKGGADRREFGIRQRPDINAGDFGADAGKRLDMDRHGISPILPATLPQASTRRNRD